MLVAWLPARQHPDHEISDGTVLPATKGVRLHDLRHIAAVLWLSNGVHFIQVAKWLGHSSYVLMLTTYAD
jgi:integrase